MPDSVPGSRVDVYISAENEFGLSEPAFLSTNLEMPDGSTVPESPTNLRVVS